MSKLRDRQELRFFSVRLITSLKVLRFEKPKEINFIVLLFFQFEDDLERKFNEISCENENLRKKIADREGRKEISSKISRQMFSFHF